MSNRTPGVIYYASAIKSFLNEKTEVIIVQREANGDWLVVVPTQGPDAHGKGDPLNTVTTVVWHAPDGTESMTAVRYAHIKDLRLAQEKPANWTGKRYREFEEQVIPVTALVNHIPLSMDRNTRDFPQAPRSDGSLHPEGDADADNTERAAEPLVGMDAKYQEVLDAVGTLAAELRGLKNAVPATEPSSDTRLFESLPPPSSEMSPAEALRRARAAAGEPPGKKNERVPLRTEEVPAAGRVRREMFDGANPGGVETPTTAGEVAKEFASEFISAMRKRAEDHDEETTGGGVRGIEKMATLRAKMRRNPGARLAHVKAEVADIMRNENTRTLESFVHAASSIPRDRLSIMMASLFCEIIRAIDEDQELLAGDIACSGLILLDQYHTTGNLDLAWNLTLLPEPTALRVNRSKPNVAAAAKAQSRRGPSRFSPLCEKKVVEAALAEMSNYDKLAKLEES